MKSKIAHMLSFRLFVSLSTVMMISFGFYAFQTYKNHEANLMETVYQNVDRTSDIIKRSTRYGMLLNHKDDVHHIINTVGNEPGVDGIRIYNKRGEIIFSTIASEKNTSVDMQAEACNICHSEEQPLISLPTKNYRRIFPAPDGHRVLGVINPIKNEPECYNAACHAHSSEQKILGVLDIKMSLAPVDMHLQKSRRATITSAALLILGVALFSGLFIYFVVRKRIKKLIIGTEEIAAGNLDYRIDIKSNDEIGHLKHSFNKMTEDLQNARREITEWSNSLEEKVSQKSKELERAQEHLIRMEKLASLGKLSATVAHEINNPLAGALTFSALVLRKLDNIDLPEEKKEIIKKYLSSIKAEITRCGDIVKNMLVFSRQAGGTFTKERLHQLIDSSIMLVHHNSKLKEIKIEKVLECDNDLILCDGGQIRQALVALLVNAIEALENGGLLLVKTFCSQESVQILIQDSGCGIPEEIIPNIFDPFFSTKKELKGVGLGLSVVYGIIQRHDGNINVESELNKGTIFTINLPREPELDKKVKVTSDIYKN